MNPTSPRLSIAAQTLSDNYRTGANRARSTTKSLGRLSTPGHRSTPDRESLRDSISETDVSPTSLHATLASVTESVQNVQGNSTTRQSLEKRHQPPLHRRSASLPSSKLHASALILPLTRVVTGKKRQLSTGSDCKSTQPTTKRPRLHSRPRYVLDPSKFPEGGFVSDNSPQSPLFFSHKVRKRPLLPRFSSSEAGATIMSTANFEDGGMRTVRMARGSLDVAISPPPATSTPTRQYAKDGPNISATTVPEELESASPTVHTLSQVGMVELLEQDDRPTLVIDLKDQNNFRPGLLQIVFANASLKAYAGLFDLVIGNGSEYLPGLVPTTTFAEFKAWVTSFVKNNESMDVCLPSFVYGGIVWTCSNLRRRFRLISGSPSPGLVSLVSNPSPSANTISTSTGRSGTISAEHQSASQEEPPDYFGDARIPILESVPSSNMSDVILTTESPGSFSGRVNGVAARMSSSDGSTVYTTVKAEKGGAVPLDRRLNEPIHRAQSSSYLDSAMSQHVDKGFFDWTRLPVTPALPRHIQFARSVDWASTSLGPIKDWPPALRNMCNLIMASPHPSAMYWGPDLVAIYNEPYILLAGQKHPQLMGQKYNEAWVEIWDDVKDVFANAMSTGQSTMKDDDCLFMNRSGFLEECYFSWSIIPLVGEDGSVVGLYNPAFEKTRRKVAERRMLTLREVGEKTGAAREVKSFWGQVLKGLDYNEYDTPFVLLYSVMDDGDSDTSSLHSNSITASKQCVLEGTLPKLPGFHQAAPTHIDLKSGLEGFGEAFREAMSTDKPVLLETKAGTLDVEMIQGIEWRGFGEMPRAAVVCPINPMNATNGDSTSSIGFLVMGINPRRPYDDDYNLFVQLLSRQLATSLASVVLFEEEIRRGQRAAQLAALDRIELSQQLALRTKEAVESETKFTRMAEFAPVGMFIANSEGHITYTNDTWHEISGYPKDVSTENWMDAVQEDDRDMVRKMWTNLVVDKIPMTAEFRYKTPWEDRNGSKGDTWVLASAYPEKNEDGSLKSVFGSITNISQQKWAEDFQKRRREEAVEMKRQQESFIDMTSHEMRNPLSAIVQCADEISTSLTNFRAQADGQDIPLALIDSNIDAAQTIALCANHQTRIVSDVLTLSKLDSGLLLVTPVDAKPVTVVQQALKMFEGELQTADIKMQFDIDDSLDQLKIDWVRVDPSRLLQILINLTTNAIKFTTSQTIRNINITLSASLERPSRGTTTRVSYIPPRPKVKDLTGGPDWGSGEEIFLHFAVSDTGRGLSESEKKLLFLRFSQASPKTHVQYGGSGLGLFISRELVELQGGEIGVSSQSGKGSTFAFYVKSRRSSESHEGKDQMPTIGSSKKWSVQKAFPKIKPATPTDATASPSRIPSESLLHVLIVEDNVVNQRVLQKQLRNLGCITYVANHGVECIDRLKESKYWVGHEEDGTDLSVILMDLEMPIMDGLTCAKEIRNLQKRGEVVRHVPIIAVTANARSEQIDTAIGAGMDDVVSKPFRIPDLIPKIDGLVKKYRDLIPTLLPILGQQNATETSNR